MPPSSPPSAKQGSGLNNEVTRSSKAGLSYFVISTYPADFYADTICFDIAASIASAKVVFSRHSAHIGFPFFFSGIAVESTLDRNQKIISGAWKLGDLWIPQVHSLWYVFLNIVFMSCLSVLFVFLCINIKYWSRIQCSQCWYCGYGLAALPIRQDGSSRCPECGQNQPRVALKDPSDGLFSSAERW